MKFGNIIMVNGEKKTAEKTILKLAKGLQKSTKKNFKNLIQLSVINTASTFKLNQQLVKKGKKKTVRTNPVFIVSDSLRIATSLKFIINGAFMIQKAAHFYQKLTDEILVSFTLKSQLVDRKNEIQKQIFTNKKYFSKFRW